MCTCLCKCVSIYLYIYIYTHITEDRVRGPLGRDLDVKCLARGARRTLRDTKSTPSAITPASSRPKTASRRLRRLTSRLKRPKRLPRCPKSAPGGAPRRLREAKIVNFLWFFNVFRVLTFSGFRRVRSAQEVLKVAPRRAKTPSRVLQDGPRGP